MTELPLMDSGFVVPVFSPRDDPIACLNKAMAFLTVVASSRFPSTNNQLSTSSNLRNQATIQDGRVTVQQVHRRQGLLNATTVKVKDIWLGYALSLSDQGMQHDLGVPDGHAIQTIIPNNAAFQTEDLDTYDSDCDDISNVKVVLMANISNYGFDVILEIVLWYLDSGCSKHMTGNRSQLMNFVSKFLGTVRFENDHITRIMGYADYQLGNVTISRVYYVKGLRHNLLFVGQFCDRDLEVAFQKNTCFIRNLEGVDLLFGSRDTNLYKISLDDMLKTSPICLLSKASRLRAPCVLGKSKKSSHRPKVEDTNQEKLHLLHMDLCGLMRDLRLSTLFKLEGKNGVGFVLVWQWGVVEVEEPYYPGGFEGFAGENEGERGQSSIGGKRIHSAQAQYFKHVTGIKVLTIYNFGP
nr:hypothetical protein [Tanacetum cinerariifolium]